MLAEKMLTFFASFFMMKDMQR